MNPNTKDFSHIIRNSPTGYVFPSPDLHWMLLSNFYAMRIALWFTMIEDTSETNFF